jgi:cholesterol transport system auxiliary component
MTTLSQRALTMKLSTISFCLLVSLLLIATGCMPSGRTPPKIDFYTLEYDPPVSPLTVALPVVLDIPRFSIAPDYNTARIVFKDTPFERNEYAYHRWHADPADLVTAFLRRDFTRSGSFLAVNDPGMRLSPTHVLSGSVDAFYEQDHAEGWESVLEVTVTLSQADEPDVSQRILFQRCFQSVQPCPTKSPSGVARAMSLAMKDISQRILAEVTAALAR